jgi:hypothetical protein
MPHHGDSLCPIIPYINIREVNMKQFTYRQAANFLGLPLHFSFKDVMKKLLLLKGIFLRYREMILLESIYRKIYSAILCIVEEHLGRMHLGTTKGWNPPQVNISSLLVFLNSFKREYERIFPIRPGKTKTQMGKIIANLNTSNDCFNTSKLNINISYTLTRKELKNGLARLSYVIYIPNRDFIAGKKIDRYPHEVCKSNGTYLIPRNSMENIIKPESTNKEDNLLNPKTNNDYFRWVKEKIVTIEIHRPQFIDGVGIIRYKMGHQGLVRGKLMKGTLFITLHHPWIPNL